MFQTPKKYVKSLLGRLLFTTGLYRFWFRQKAVVTCFHRVDDRLKGDELSCTVEEFRSYLRFFRRYFEVISLPELLSRLESGQSVGGCLVITFDDGYRDNVLNAARELSSEGLSACFFVATGFVETQTVAWWDEALPFRPEWMSWEEVKALANAGFDIGAHTVNHIDMGKVDRETAEEEVRASRQKLEDELRKEIDLFAYPYGQPEQMTEDNRCVIIELGMRCCVSAFGGVVWPGDSAFRLRRQPISVWFQSPYQFGFEVMLSR